MRLPKWFRRFLLKHTFPSDKKNLREFAYLDEVSLRSLLSSQNGGLTDTTSEQTGRTWLVEGGTTVSIGTDALGKAGGTSRFQTSNSSTLQTSRKATVQSWFRELHAMSDLRLISVVGDVKPLANQGGVKMAGNTSVTVSSALLTRGTLIELRVRLTADPIFQLGTMLHEFLGMAEDFPGEMIQGISGLPEAGMINKLLDRLLAGLIPIKSEAIDYAVVEVDDQEYVVHKDALMGLALPSRPLFIVGVTEHLAYWKDIRRVLFSGSVFTIMCRVSRDGLHDGWSPVKLTDLFGLVAPDLNTQLFNATKFIQPSTKAEEPEPVGDQRLAMTLMGYAAMLLAQRDQKLDEEQEALLRKEIKLQSLSVTTAEDQRAAFDAVRRRVRSLVGVRVSPKVDIQLREKSRLEHGLPYFPTAAEPVRQRVEVVQPIFKSPDRLIDTEVVAIYW